MNGTEVFVKGNRISKAIGLSRESLKRYRLKGQWQEGIHWQRLNSRSTLYNLPLILDWVANRTNPHAHQQAIELYLASLPCNQPKKRGRKSS